MYPNDTIKSVKLCGCGCGNPTPIAKQTSRRYGHIQGQPTRFIASHNGQRGRLRPVAERFWEKVDKRGPDECWEWKNSRAKRGYGRFKLNGKYHQANRVAYELATGHPPGDMEVCHECDNPACCNPNHLFLGTRSQNMIDCRDKGRSNRPVGEDSGKSKLTEDAVRSIRSQATQKRRYEDIAREFGVTKENVSAVVRRLTWKHVI